MRYDERYDEPEEAETYVTKHCVVRKARKSFKVGDLIEVQNGFTYDVEEKHRTGYFTREKLVAYGPQWGIGLMGRTRGPIDTPCKWQLRSAKKSWEAYYGPKSVALQDRDALLAKALDEDLTFEGLEDLKLDIAAWEAWYEADLQWRSNEVRKLIVKRELLKEHKAAEMAYAKQKAEERLLREQELVAFRAAKAGDKVTWRGVSYTKGGVFGKTVYFSNAEYYGEACDAEVQNWVRLLKEDGTSTAIKCP
jgi:hypothetical protein